MFAFIQGSNYDPDKHRIGAADGPGELIAPKTLSLIKTFSKNGAWDKFQGNL